MPRPSQYRDFRYEDFIPAKVQSLSAAITHLVSKELEAVHALSLNEWRILAHIAAVEGATEQSVANTSGVDKGWVSRSLNALLERGLVVRSTDRNDRRKRPLELTDDGVAAFEKAAGDIRSLQNRLLDAFSAEDHEAFVRLMTRLQRTAETMRAEE